ncbi:MAG: site-2 protease family protein [Candidatus Levybacteria bacterium]|nr:site-2 protease family protein [Candidatus Levybacteria bacterium]
MSLLLGVITLGILIFSAILHEVAHGFVADRFGDPTARLAGRLTLNPKNHIDLIMSIILPLLLILSGSPVIFGAAKPVPVDPFNLKEGQKDIALVSLAGPLTNIALAVVGTLIFRIFFPEFSLFQIVYSYPSIGTLSDFLAYFVGFVVHLNLLLAIFNLIPIPPLDGSKVFALLLPKELAFLYLSLSSIGMFIIFFLLLFPIGGLSLGSLIFNLVTFAEHLLGF